MDKIVMEPLVLFVAPTIFKCLIMFSVPIRKHRDITKLNEKCLRKFQCCMNFFILIPFNYIERDKDFTSRFNFLDLLS